MLYAEKKVGRVYGKKIVISDRLARESCTDEGPLRENWKPVKNTSEVA